MSSWFQRVEQGIERARSAATTAAELSRGIYKLALDNTAILKQIGYTMAEMLERLARIDARLEEAAREIPAEITKLRDELADDAITPEVDAILTRMESRASDLAGIVKNEAPLPDPADDPSVPADPDSPESTYPGDEFVGQPEIDFGTSTGDSEVVEGGDEGRV